MRERGIMLVIFSLVYFLCILRQKIMAQHISFAALLKKSFLKIVFLRKDFFIVCSRTEMF